MYVYVSPCDLVLLFQATMHFAGNKARVGPVMFVSNLAACEWYSLNSSEYFESDNMRRWDNILEIRLAILNNLLRYVLVN